MDYQELKWLEDGLWEAADQLRANSKLTASECSMPVLGLIFLRHATTRFAELLPQIEATVSPRATGALREKQIRLGFEGKAARDAKKRPCCPAMPKNASNPSCATAASTPSNAGGSARRLFQR